MSTAPAAPPSYKKDIRPLFRDIDIQEMKDNGLDLSDYSQVKARSSKILSRLKARDELMMPPADHGGPWPDKDIALFAAWIAGGHQP